MISRGHFPVPGHRSDHADSPRVGDGFVRVDATGRVAYASPNATSVFRRLGHSGDLSGHLLADLVRALVPPRRRPDEETLSAVLGGRIHRDSEIESDGVALILRAIPLRPEGEHIGALILVRDVTELRRRDRELVTKDATIREIHHRVKNNLQTVAALLRLQARRMDTPDARAALEEAVRRVGSIAIVHETLSEAVEEHVEFDEIADRLGRMVTDVSARSGRACGSSAPAASACSPRRWPPRWRWCSPRCSRTPSSTATAPGTPAGSPWTRAGWSAGCTSRSRTTGAGLPADFDLDAVNLGSVDRAHARGVRAGRSVRDGAGAPAGDPGDPGRDRRTGGVSRQLDQAVRTRARALRRLSARRSSSLRPPQTPWSCPASSAHARHCSRTSQRRHTCLASSIWRMAGPVLPIGKNSSGSSSRHAER